jgi:hypothetical protein
MKINKFIKKIIVEKNTRIGTLKLNRGNSIFFEAEEDYEFTDTHLPEYLPEEQLIISYDPDEIIENEVDYKLNETDAEDFMSIVADRIGDYMDDSIFQGLNGQEVTDLIRNTPEYKEKAQKIIEEWVYGDSDLLTIYWEGIEEELDGVFKNEKDFIDGIIINKNQLWYVEKRNRSTYIRGDWTTSLVDISSSKDFFKVFSGEIESANRYQDPDIKIFMNYETDGSQYYVVKIGNYKYKLVPAVEKFAIDEEVEIIATGYKGKVIDVIREDDFEYQVEFEDADGDIDNSYFTGEEIRKVNERLE